MSDDAHVDEAIASVKNLCEYAYEKGYHEHGYDPFKVVADAIVALRARAEEAERARNVIRELYNAKSPLHERRKMPGYAGDNPESPDVLTTMGHWPECRCVECYAIHCLGEAQSEVLALRTALRVFAIRPALSPGEQFTAGCRQCNADWPQNGGEVHAAGCLAKDKGG